MKTFDFFSIETHFLINGEKRYKNALGGLLSLISFSIAVSAIIYFVREFLMRESSTIITNQEVTNKVSIDNFSRFPLMIRLSLSGNIIAEENYKVWKIIGARWGTTSNSTKQFTQPLIMETCDINRHFGDYRYLFENMTDLKTFICPRFSNNNNTNALYGLYGDTQPYSFYNFAIRPCVNELDGNICEKEEYIKSFLNQVFLDVRTIDFSVANFEENPAKPIARGDRFTVSQSIFRRIWMSFKSVEYNTDGGYIFTQFSTKKFHQIEQFNSEVDMRDQKTNVTPYTFLWITLINSSNRIVYYRTYMKAQALLADVGGVVKGILTVASLLNYYISIKLYYSELINIDQKTSSNNNAYCDLFKSGYLLNNNNNRNKNNSAVNLNDKRSNNQIFKNKKFNNNINDKNNNAPALHSHYVVPVKKYKQNSVDSNKNYMSNNNNNNNHHSNNNEASKDRDEKNYNLNVIVPKDNCSNQTQQRLQVDKDNSTPNNLLNQLNIDENNSIQNKNFYTNIGKNNNLEIINDIDQEKNFNVDEKFSTQNKFITEEPKMNMQKAKIYPSSDNKNKFLRLTLTEIFLPFFCSRKSSNKAIYNLGEDKIKDILDIKNYVKSINELQTIKSLILNHDQLILFKCLFDYQNTDKQKNQKLKFKQNNIFQKHQDMANLITNLKSKPELTRIDELLIKFYEDKSGDNL